MKLKTHISNPVSIALVGVANHGATILRALRAIEGLNLHGCYDIQQESATRIAAVEECRVYRAYEALLEDSEIEAVLLITPNHVHEAQAIEAMKAGKHVFIEKPLAVNSASARRIIDVSHATKRTLQVGHNTRKRKIFRDVKRLLDEGMIGIPVSVEAHFSYSPADAQQIPEWKLSEASCPLLPMTQLGIHFIDLLQYFLGDVREVSCFAGHQALRSADRKIIDSTVAMMAFENGILGTLQAHYVVPETFEIRLYGTEGKLVCSASQRQLTHKSAAQREVKDYADDPLQSIIDELEEFGACIRSGTRPEVDGEVGLRNVQIIDAMMEAHRDKRSISLLRYHF